MRQHGATRGPAGEEDAIADVTVAADGKPVAADDKTVTSDGRPVAADDKTVAGVHDTLENDLGNAGDEPADTADAESAADEADRQQEGDLTGLRQHEGGATGEGDSSAAAPTAGGANLSDEGVGTIGVEGGAVAVEGAGNDEAGGARNDAVGGVGNDETGGAGNDAVGGAGTDAVEGAENDSPAPEEPIRQSGVLEGFGGGAWRKALSMFNRS